MQCTKVRNKGRNKETADARPRHAMPAMPHTQITHIHLQYKLNLLASALAFYIIVNINNNQQLGRKEL